MEHTPKVTVLMNCRNAETFLKEAIDSVYSQTYQDWEILFFDNNSSDRSAEIAKGYDPRLKYHFNSKTVPLGTARNLAIALAKGQYIAILDCDDVWLPTKLELQLATFNKKPGRRIGLSYTDSMRFDAGGVDLASYSLDRHLAEGDVYSKLIRDCFVDMSTAVFPKDIFFEVGGIDARYNQVEDWDLWLKIARKYDISLVPEILVKTRIHSGNVSRDFEEHNREKLELLGNLQVTTDKERESLRFAKRDLALRNSLLRLFLQKQGLRNLVRNLFIMAWHCLNSPIVALELFKRYFNPKMLTVCKRKFLKSSL